MQLAPLAYLNSQDAGDSQPPVTRETTARLLAHSPIGAGSFINFYAFSPPRVAHFDRPGSAPAKSPNFVPYGLQAPPSSQR